MALSLSSRASGSRATYDGSYEFLLPASDYRLAPHALVLDTGKDQLLTAETLRGAARQFVDWQTAVDRNAHNQLLMENACLELSRLATLVP